MLCSTGVSEGDIKDSFCFQLNETIANSPKRGITIVIGDDLDAKVGVNNEGLKHIMEKYGTGARSDRQWRTVYQHLTCGDSFPQQGNLDISRLKHRKSNWLFCNQQDVQEISYTRESWTWSRCWMRPPSQYHRRVVARLEIQFLAKHGKHFLRIINDFDISKLRSEITRQ